VKLSLRPATTRTHRKSSGCCMRRARRTAVCMPANRGRHPAMDANVLIPLEASRSRSARDRWSVSSPRNARMASAGSPGFTSRLRRAQGIGTLLLSHALAALPAGPAVVLPAQTRAPAASTSAAASRRSDSPTAAGTKSPARRAIPRF
jgi:hypothetical protein